ncbi:MAG: CHASE2 domain-containing protein [Candidatus Methylomirabilia bacterium]
MAESGKDRLRTEELIASLRAIHAGQEALVEELRALHQEIRAFREELGARAFRPEDSVAPAPASPTGPALPSVPRQPPQRAWRGMFRRLLARLPKPLTETSRSLLEQTWLLGLVAGLAVAGASELNLLQPVEVLAQYPKEWVTADRSRQEILNQIVLVTIDEESLEELGPWGKRWRAFHGRLLKNLADDGARAVGVDVLFNTPSEEYDPAFVEGIRYARSKGVGVVVGMEYDARRGRLKYPASPVREAVTDFASVYFEKDRVTNLVRYVSMFRPDSTAGERATRLIPAFSIAVAVGGGKRLEEFPRYREGRMPIDFAGSSSSFETVSYADVHGKRFPPGTFKDKYVMVGMLLVASKDFFDTPVESQMPGVVIHANALYTLLRGIGRPLGLPWSAAVILLVAAVSGAVCTRFRRARRTMMVLALVVGYWGLAIALESMRNPLDLDLVPATVAVGLVWAGVAVREKIVAMRELGLTLGLPQEVLRRLEEDRAFQRGTLTKRVTALAADVKNYSAFSRSQEPAHVRAIMAEYQRMVEGVIYRRGGYVNKFVGDATLVVFGYPMYEEATSLRGVLAAGEIQEGLRALTEKWHREDRAGIAEIRIGINTGPVSISYLGSAKKQLDVMGSNVDLAARLESAAGEFDCLALLSPATYEEVKHRVRTRKVPVQLKNRPDVTEAFALDGFLDQLSAVSTAAKT